VVSRLGIPGETDILPARDGGDLVEEALDDVEFGGTEWAHRGDHAGEQGPKKSQPLQVLKLSMHPL
jgi:hypothetical protein